MIEACGESAGYKPEEDGAAYDVQLPGRLQWAAGYCLPWLRTASAQVIDQSICVMKRKSLYLLRM